MRIVMRVINISLIMGMVLLLGANVYAQGPDAKSNRKAAMDAFNKKYDNNLILLLAIAISEE